MGMSEGVAFPNPGVWTLVMANKIERGALSSVGHKNGATLPSRLITLHMGILQGTEKWGPCTFPCESQRV